jgi:hypothetical protein
MTFAPPTLRRLGNYWTDQGGVNLGIVGDAYHTAGYHLGKDRIYAPSGLGGADYSVQLERDKNGLSDAAAAIDLGRLRGSLEQLYTFSAWLVEQCQAKAPGTRDVREVIYSPDGSKVQRYSGVDGQIHTGPGNGDAGHLGHTHISYYRDSESRDKVGVFEPYFEDDMAAQQARITAHVTKLIDIPKGADLLDLDGVTKVGDNAFDRLMIRSPYGRGSEDRNGERWARREFAIDLDGSGPDTARTVLVWIPVSSVHDEIPPQPAPTHRYVITVDAAELTVTEDGVPVE